MSVLTLSPDTRRPAPTWNRLRLAVTAVFAFDGFVFGSWAARIPDVTAQVGATHATLGVALLCVSLGALASMQLTGVLCARLGTGPITALGTALLCLVVPLPGLAGSVPALSAALLAFGAATGLLNVAVNSAGVAVEARRPGRALLPGLHAAFSIGGLAGAALGGLASVLGPVAPHLIAVAAGGLVVTVLTARTLVALDPRPTRVPATEAPVRRSRGLVVLLGVIAGCTAFGEGSLTDWGALHLKETLGASAGLAAVGYAGFSSAMAAGRLAGGRLLALLGETRLLAGGAVLAAVGMTAALLTSSLPVALAGFGLVGLGLANLFPVTIARAGALGGAGGVALASTVGYSGLLGGPPVIGFLAEHSGLPTALATVPVLAAVAAVLALVVRAERPALRVVLPTRIPFAATRRAVRAAGGRVAATAGPPAPRTAAAVRAHAAGLPALTEARAGTTGANGPRIRPYPGLELLAA